MTTDDTQALVDALNPLTSRLRTDVTFTKSEIGVRWKRDEPLTDGRLRAHLNGECGRGCCPIAEGASTTRVAALDLDSHRGEVPWAAMCLAALQIIEDAQGRGLAATPFRSSGGHGIHLYFVWDQDQDAYSVRMALREVLGACGYADGSGGVAAGQVEVFPKQNSVGSGELGSGILLPLYGQSVPLEELMGEALLPMERAAITDLAWPVSAGVEHQELPVRASLELEHSPEAYRKALCSIPNGSGALESRELWFTVLCAAKEAGVSEEDALEWSELHPSHDEAAFRKTWKSIKTGEPNGVPAQYLIEVAQQHGFRDHVAEMFEVLGPLMDGPATLPNLTLGTYPMVQALPLASFKLHPKIGMAFANLRNLVMALHNNSSVGYDIVHDRFLDEVLITEVGCNDWRPLQNADMIEIRMRLECFGFMQIGREIMRDALDRHAREHQVDCAEQWIDGLGWDGVPRVESFMATYVGAEDTEYARAVSRYTWTALAARVLEPGCQLDMVPVWIGEQGVGKTQGLKAMVPAIEHYVEIDLGTRDTDAARMMRGALLGELAELKGLTSRDSESIKAFITRTHERWIPKYRELPVTFPRRLLFIGTTNETEFLADSTGERRWLPIHVGARHDVDREAIERDRSQLWAEARVMFLAGGLQYKNAERLARAQHAQHKISDPWSVRVGEWLECVDPLTGFAPSAEPLTINDIMCGALQMQPRDLNRGNQMRMAGVMKGLGYEKARTRAGGFQAMRWVKK